WRRERELRPCAGGVSDAGAVERERGDNRERVVGRIVGDRPCKRGSKIVQLAIGARGPCSLVTAAHSSTKLFGEARAVRGVPSAEQVGVARGFEPFLCVLADRLQQPIPRLTPS